MSDVWLTSDWHVGHANILRYCSRPFLDAEHMREQLIERHNALVKPSDTIYDLGSQRASQ